MTELSLDKFPSWWEKGATELMNCPHRPSSLKPPVIESGGSGTKATCLLPLSSRSLWEPVLSSRASLLPLRFLAPTTTDHSSGSRCGPLSMVPQGHQREMGLLCQAFRTAHCLHLSKPLISPSPWPCQMFAHLASAQMNTSSCFRTLSRAYSHKTTTYLAY